MPEYSGPFPQQEDFSLDSWRRRFRAGRGHVLGPTSSAGACSAGTGSAVNVTGLEAIVDGMLYRSSLDPVPADVTIAAPTNSSTSPRRNMVVLRLDPQATPPTGSHTGSIALATVEGAPAASPVDPAPTQTDTGVFELPLASYLMPGSASAQNPSGFTDLRRFSDVSAVSVNSTTGATASGTTYRLNVSSVRRADGWSPVPAVGATGITIGASGWYQVDAYSSWQTNGTGARYLTVAASGTGTLATASARGHSEAEARLSVSAVEYLTAGTIVHSESTHWATVNINLVTARFAVARIR